jgi:hypothetical protein
MPLQRPVDLRKAIAIEFAVAWRRKGAGGKIRANFSTGNGVRVWNHKNC